MARVSVLPRKQVAESGALSFLDYKNILQRLPEEPEPGSAPATRVDGTGLPIRLRPSMRGAVLLASLCCFC